MNTLRSILVVITTLSLSNCLVAPAGPPVRHSYAPMGYGGGCGGYGGAYGGYNNYYPSYPQCGPGGPGWGWSGQSSPIVVAPGMFNVGHR